MTIQLSVTLWTILCFLALMVILDRLLFRPMLSFMDARRARIEAARAVREESAAAREAELERREASRREAAHKAQTAETQKMSAIRRQLNRHHGRTECAPTNWECQIYERGDVGIAPYRRSTSAGNFAIYRE